LSAISSATRTRPSISPPRMLSSSRAPSKGRRMANARLKHEILEVIERQLETGDPPETRQTLDRLLASGYPRQQAVQLIGAALVEEIWWMMREHRPFDREHFRALLDAVG